ncbi:KEOPS complex subunit Cgi121 [Haloferax volcanii]|uniref:KEOPS complex Cgi121-like subunit n=3 Tax=Haloferax volcanii TaxID=2246 RepID=A0A384KCJ6_HALVD|nr:KEOPS complex subunit Cgi121 [Haloferax volcanii]ADE03079.1 KEOPS complex subunit Cgi121 [Haloferax volcanii DS2]ELY24227.1 KEOPS complex Cgi121-like subunit [Haloferax volcanii DS2]MBS8118813.1 KEOPS complex component [Haloferax volcanii]MBS8123827.1 KEOPS complex component [Haloferax volcanii]MBS8127696.1 KEOPS complex component [Haloferax volcanii]
MRLLEAEATVSDLDSFIAAVGDVADETGATVQAFDARYVVDREHLERAVELADRAIARGNEIARDRAVEILLYASGRRQINRAFEIGVSEGTLPVVVLVDGGDEAAAEAALFDRLDFEPAETLGDYDESLVRDVFDVGETELHVVDGDLPALVRERVALLAVDR